MRNHSYENDFDLHENETACRTHFIMKGFALRPRFETEAKENSEMAYSSVYHPKKQRKFLKEYCDQIFTLSIFRLTM